ncbi:MAG: hypothetical protein AAGF01_03040 [Cyanobacteria bacterium P01_G01_bin.38]
MSVNLGNLGGVEGGGDEGDEEEVSEMGFDVSAQPNGRHGDTVKV